MQTTDICAAILDRSNGMTIADLTKINEALKERWNSVQYHTARSFRKGDAVQFTSSRRNAVVKGVVTKVNTKTVQVLADGVNWKVAASLLSPAA